MRIIYLGSDIIAGPCLRKLLRDRHEIVAVITQPDRRAGRGRKPRATPIKQLAEQLGLNVLDVEDANAPQVLGKIEALEPDLLVTFAFNQKLGKNLLAVARHGAINVHPSLLPKYRGAAPIARAILNGDTETGISIIRMAEDLDAGDIFSQKRWAIAPTETTGELETRLGELAAPMLAKVVEDIAQGKAECTPQKHEQASDAPKLKKTDGLLDFSLPAEELLNYIRAFTPWPGAFAFYCGQTQAEPERVVITKASANAVASKVSPVTAEPGTVLEGLCIQCRPGTLKIERLKPAGGKEMSWADFVNGRRVQVNDRFLGAGARS